MATKKTEIVEIKPIEEQKVTLRIVGDTPLIMHAWSEKAKKEMLDKQMRIAKTSAKEAKSPVADFIDSMYWIAKKPEEKTFEGFQAAIDAGAKFGFPVTAFKQAAISAAYRLGWVPDKMSLRGVFYIDADENQMIEIKSDPPIMREDMVRVGMGTADIRYRGEFRNWYADLTIRFNRNGRYDIGQIVNIINAGGYTCGIGEWRPERDGQYGTYHIQTSEKDS